MLESFKASLGSYEQPLSAVAQFNHCLCLRLAPWSKLQQQQLQAMLPDAPTECEHSCTPGRAASCRSWLSPALSPHRNPSHGPHMRSARLFPASESAATLPGVAVARGAPRVGQHRVDAVPVLLVQCKAEERLVVRHVARVAGAWAAAHPTAHSGLCRMEPSVRPISHDQHPNAQSSSV